MSKPGNPAFKKGKTPPVGRLWKKGESGNPDGRPKIPDDIKIARKLTAVEFERICGVLFSMSKRQLKDLIEDDNTPVLTALIATILEKGITESSRNELNYFIERFLGKVPEQANFTGSLNGGLVDFIAAGKKKGEDE